MESRYSFCERIIRSVYGEQPGDDSSITVNLVNKWLSEGIALAAKQNYRENIQIDGVSYVNNSFYTTFRGISISFYENFIFRLSLPQIPLGIGKNEGVGTIQFVDTNGIISDAAIPLSENQVGYFQNMRPIPNKTLYYTEGSFIYAISYLQLSDYTAKIRMISGGDSTDINSTLNVPDDYLPVATKYCIDMLRMERAQPKDLVNDGSDTV